MRAGVTHWSHGAIIAALEGAIFLLPFSGEHHAAVANLKHSASGSPKMHILGGHGYLSDAQTVRCWQLAVECRNPGQ